MPLEMTQHDYHEIILTVTGSWKLSIQDVIRMIRHTPIIIVTCSHQMIWHYCNENEKKCDNNLNLALHRSQE